MRLNYAKIASEGFGHFRKVIEYVSHSGLEASLIHMIYLRVSQINGCSYCVDLHWSDAVKSGVDHRKLNALCIWRDTPFFSEREQVALAWAESVTHCAKSQESQPLYDKALAQFGEKGLCDLTFAIAQMNTFNRIAIAFHTTPK